MKKKPKTCVGFWKEDADYADSFCVSYEIHKTKCFPAIPASEVERDYVPKAELERWETLWKNAKKVISGDYGEARKWEKKYRNLSKKIEMVKQDYMHKDVVKEVIEKSSENIAEIVSRVIQKAVEKMPKREAMKLIEIILKEFKKEKLGLK